MRLFIFVTSLCFALMACNSRAENKLVKCGFEWINLHQGNPDLIGIYVQQYPDSKLERATYEGKHPAMIIYLFKNNRIHTVMYTPIGQVETGGWSDISDDHWVKKMAKKDFRPDLECGYWVNELKGSMN